jgi:hypothetical protein
MPYGPAVFNEGAIAFATGPPADLIAAFEIEGNANRGPTISVWSLARRVRIARFTTDPVWGGAMLAIVAEAPA